MSNIVEFVQSDKTPRNTTSTEGVTVMKMENFKNTKVDEAVAPAIKTQNQLMELMFARFNIPASSQEAFVMGFELGAELAAEEIDRLECQLAELRGEEDLDKEFASRM